MGKRAKRAEKPQKRGQAIQGMENLPDPFFVTSLPYGIPAVVEISHSVFRRTMAELEQALQEQGQPAMWAWGEHLISNLVTKNLLFDTRGITNDAEFRDFCDDVVLVCCIKLLQTGQMSLCDEETAQHLARKSGWHPSNPR